MERDYTFYNEAQNAAFDCMVATVKNCQISTRKELRFRVTKDEDGDRNLYIREEYDTDFGPAKAFDFFATTLIAKANALDLSCIVRTDGKHPLVRIWTTNL